MSSILDWKPKIGILGGGQLGWMMILEGRKFPFTFYVLDDDKSAPACKIADKCFTSNEYKEFVENSDIVTFEFEHVNEKALEYAEEKGKLFPAIRSVELKRERYKEKLFYRDHGLPTPKFFVAEDGQEALKILRENFNNIGVIKESQGGYDGKGQYFIKGDVEKYEFLKQKKVKMVVEEYVNFDFEASVIITRDRKGRVAYYPPTYNYNEKGILVYNYGPYNNKEIIDLAIRLVNELDYVGTLGLEVFVANGKVLINEFAPRVHNTGHYTLDGALISQFEQHLRAILGMSLGPTDVLCPSGMINILGTDKIPPEVLNYGKVYWYSKSEVRKRRKVGHINIVGNNLEEVKQKIDKIMQLIYPNGLDL
ncbi:5-(carboxyamino)imidazole ribonucleotide synthase [Sulfolobus sp. A20]|uniref:5-(carboxyamino)imidazole ribonucleotide synthase n=1 Tax=Sulfolobaceae TaxID=118883 RepID=UPI000846271F|nr:MULTISPECIES: 5-(carboxyamino)imidazole ribonucleotide synthase [unclassified Sulfolobus]TRM76172.1 5-(carboxyamino)imidazole ribonucleotide synthase [Sulfolobus sp. E5]TRM84814.1 5-(carboxyamino)imidazole ribonucleotide synthase [Sulfolobus sp. F3]TRM88927.1 5-(carboxyamino)imidazole ribonucleotide synthase [Sulfolobus sp. C3]TRM98607.1 5-(carboxyamino)imidazole ribonucleotide synthase [Sulfolobus sp. F1]TRN02135.1 5-(carboxyamino)imidazole ribonucleotide synthase [Sulfolobus sp. E1]